MKSEERGAGGVKSKGKEKSLSSRVLSFSSAKGRDDEEEEKKKRKRRKRRRKKKKEKKEKEKGKKGKSEGKKGGNLVLCQGFVEEPEGIRKNPTLRSK